MFRRPRRAPVGSLLLCLDVRRHGDDTSRLDRLEPALNENAVGDPRDTTSPAAMARLTGELVLGDALRSTWTARRPRRQPWKPPSPGWGAGPSRGPGRETGGAPMAVQLDDVRP